MIADLKPYPEYKESGLPWLGRIPARWNVPRLRRLALLNPSKSEARQIRRENVPVTFLPMENVGTDGLIKCSTAVNAASVWDGFTYFSRGDVLIAKITPCFENGKGAYLSSLPTAIGFGSTEFHVVRPGPHLLGAFLRCITSTPEFLHQGKMSMTGSAGQQRVPSSFIKDYSVALPPLDEQAAIVRFLDWANGRLERAIRAKRKVIALLNEQKQAIIQRAVTRGLDPSVPLKPSGIPWLGNIPKHWETPLLGQLLNRVEQGWSPIAAEGELADDQWAVLTLSSVRRGAFNPHAIKPVPTSASIPRGIEVKDGDLLLTRSNTRDRVGDVCLARNVRARTMLCDLIYRLHLRDGSIDPDFLVDQLLSAVGRGQIERDARGSSGTMPKISQGHIKSWRILLPPLGEQVAIARAIQSGAAPLGSAVEHLNREIDLLREYRTRLTADVVTGKLDVRGVELPEVDEEPLEPSNEVTDEELEDEPQETEELIAAGENADAD